MFYGLKYPVTNEGQHLPLSDVQWREDRCLGQIMGQDPLLSSLFLNHILTFRDYVSEKDGYDPKKDAQCCAAIAAIDETFPEWRLECTRSDYFPEAVCYAPNQTMIDEVNAITMGLSGPDTINPEVYRQFDSNYKYLTRLKSLVEHILSLQIHYIDRHGCSHLDPTSHYCINALDIGGLGVTLYNSLITNITFPAYGQTDYDRMLIRQKTELDNEIHELSNILNSDTPLSR
jgi:hypothetical protein